MLVGTGPNKVFDITHVLNRKLHCYFIGYLTVSQHVLLPWQSQYAFKLNNTRSWKKLAVQCLCVCTRACVWVRAHTHIHTHGLMDNGHRQIHMGLHTITCLLVRLNASS